MGGHVIRIGAGTGDTLVLEISDDLSARGREMEAALLRRASLDLAAAGLRKRPWAIGAAALVSALFWVPFVRAITQTIGEMKCIAPFDGRCSYF